MHKRLLRVSPKTVPLYPDALEDFLAVKAAAGRAAVTLADYRRHVAAFFSEEGSPETEADLRRSVLAHMQRRTGMAPASFNLRLSYLRGFFRWCVREGLLVQDPTREVHKRADEGRPRRAAEDTLRRLLDLPDKRTWSGLRDYTLLVFLLDTGARPSEALGLIPADLDLGALQVTIPAGIAKTRRSRVLPVLPVTAAALRKLLAHRPDALSPSMPIFCTAYGLPLGRHGFARRMAAYGRTLGAPVRPYDLRHAFALLFLRGGGDAFALQRMLGHSSLAMTRRYVDLADTDLKRSHDAASPLNRLVGPGGSKLRGPRRP